MQQVDLISTLVALLPFGIIGAIRQAAWIIKLILSSRWHDIKATGPLPYTKVGVAVTIKGEPPATFQMVLDSLLAERIDQVCITFDKGEVENMALTDQFAAAHAGDIDVRWQIVNEKGKRKGLKVAIAMSEGMDIIICMDSDTIFGTGVKQSIMEAFSKPNIGGVTVKQRVYKPDSLMHYLFDIRLQLRYHIEAPGQAVSGYMSCLSGRCSAYLAGPLQEISANLVNESWLGIHKTGGGEDKCLTTFLQDAGYNAAAIVDSVVYTRPERSVKIYVSQSLRWARNSWFSDLRALFQRKPWMVRNPIMMFYTLDRMMSTFTLALAIWYMAILLLTQQFAAAGLLTLWYFISRGIKIYPYLLETRRWWIIPAYTFFSTFLAVVKIHALVTLWETGWLTRGATQGAQQLRKIFINNGYRGITASIMMVLGVVAFRTQDVWLADIPGLAEAGEFYRPGQTGLEVAQRLYPELRTTYIALSDVNDLGVLNAALPDVARLGEEISPLADYLQVVNAASLNEEAADIANVLAFGNLRNVPMFAAYYGVPRQGDRLIDAEPFSTEDVLPIRVARATWDTSDWIVVANNDINNQYRVRGKVLSVADALVEFETDLGSAYFVPQPEATQPMIYLNQLDEKYHTLEEASGAVLEGEFVLIPTGEIDASSLSLTVDLRAITTLQSGTVINVRLNEITLGTLIVDSSATEPVTMRLPSAQQIVAETPGKSLVLKLDFPASALVADPEHPEISEVTVWQQIASYSTLSWVSKEPLPVSLKTYPMPYLSMQEQDRTVIILPDAPTDADRNQVIRLVAYMGANGHDIDGFSVMTPATLDQAVLAQANVIVLGTVDRQSLVRLFDETALMSVGVNIRSILPTEDTGFLWTGRSPWGSSKHLTIVTGVTEIGSTLAALTLERTTQITENPAMAALVRADGTFVAFNAYDSLQLNPTAPIMVAQPDPAGVLLR